MKLRDEECNCRELKWKQQQHRKSINESYGEHKQRTRRTIKKLRAQAVKVKNEHKEKYRKKVEFLKKIYMEEEEEKVKKLREEVREFAEAKVFDKRKFEEIKVADVKVTIVGNVPLTDGEYRVLQLHPKLALPVNLEQSDLEYEFELGMAKVRMSLAKMDGESLEDSEGNQIEQTEEEEEAQEEIEARSRAPFDPEERVYDAAQPSQRSRN